MIEQVPLKYPSRQELVLIGKADAVIYPEQVLKLKKVSMEKNND